MQFKIILLKCIATQKYSEYDKDFLKGLFNKIMKKFISFSIAFLKGYWSKWTINDTL